MQYLGKSDLAKLFRVMHAENKIHWLAALTQFYTGTRVSQLLDIRGEDIFEKDGKWVVLVRAAKRGNIVIQSLHVDADEAFDMTPLIEMAKIKGRSRIFGSLSRQYYNLCLKRYAEAAGIHSTFAHSHIFRHSVAIAIFDATQRVGAITQFLGHKSSTAALCYLAENDGKLGQEAVDALQLA
jgi:integrase